MDQYVFPPLPDQAPQFINRKENGNNIWTFKVCTDLIWSEFYLYFLVWQCVALIFFLFHSVGSLLSLSASKAITRSYFLSEKLQQRHALLHYTLLRPDSHLNNYLSIFYEVIFLHMLEDALERSGVETWSRIGLWLWIVRWERKVWIRDRPTPSKKVRSMHP